MSINEIWSNSKYNPELFIPIFFLFPSATGCYYSAFDVIVFYSYDVILFWRYNFCVLLLLAFWGVSVLIFFEFWLLTLELYIFSIASSLRISVPSHSSSVVVVSTPQMCSSIFCHYDVCYWDSFTIPLLCPI